MSARNITSPRLVTITREITLPKSDNRQCNPLGRLLGQNGRNIKWLREYTDCEIYVNSDEWRNHKTDTKVTIRAKDAHHDVAHCKAVIAAQWVDKIAQSALNGTPCPIAAAGGPSESFNDSRQWNTSAHSNSINECDLSTNWRSPAPSLRLPEVSPWPRSGSTSPSGSDSWLSSSSNHSSFRPSSTSPTLESEWNPFSFAGSNWNSFGSSASFLQPEPARASNVLPPHPLLFQNHNQYMGAQYHQAPTLNPLLYAPSSFYPF